jgi:hypothetical protein
MLILGHQANIRTVGQHGVERYEIGRVCRAATGRQSWRGLRARQTRKFIAGKA